KRVLEIGVGTGRYAVPLQKSGIRVVGVDISRKMVEIGLAKGLRDVIFADAARLPFKSGSFDVGTTNHVLHLIPDWRDALSEIARRTYSSQWDVPEEVHRKAMEPLRTKWRGKEFQLSYTLEVTFWRSERLPEIAAD